MTQLSKNFWRDEFRCKCGCGADTVDAELVSVLQSLRDAFGAAVTVNSGIRCEDHNRAGGGSPNSQHLLGRAADITVAGISPHKVHAYLAASYPKRYGMGRYDTFTHIDTRTGQAARWEG